MLAVRFLIIVVVVFAVILTAGSLSHLLGRGVGFIVLLVCLIERLMPCDRIL